MSTDVAVTVDEAMYGLAARRAAVLLASGRTARLVVWQPSRRGRKARRYMRVEFPSGGRATMHVRNLVRVLDNGKAQDGGTADLLDA